MPNSIGVYPANFGGFLNGALHYQLTQRGKTVGVVGDKIVVNKFVINEFSCNGVVQHNVGAGPHGQVQVSSAGGIGAAGVYADNADVRVGRFMGFDAPPDDGVAPGGVGSLHQKQVGFFDIVVTNRHGIFSQRQLISHHRRRHAQPRIGIDVVRANESFDEFTDQVILFRQALPRHVKRDRIGTVFLDKRLENGRCALQGHIPAYALHGPVAAEPHLRIEQPVALVHDRIGQVHAFRAKHSLVGRVVFVAFHGELTTGLFHNNPAADATVTAGGLMGCHGFGRKVDWGRRVSRVGYPLIFN